MSEYLRAVGLEDISILYEWANDPIVRKNSINQSTISWEEHNSWFHARLLSPTTQIFIMMCNEEPCGQIRFDFNNDVYQIDYSIDSEFRGKGLGTRIIELGINRMKELAPLPKFIAKVNIQNVPSIKIFEQCGFEKLNEEFINKDRYVHYQLK